MSCEADKHDNILMVSLLAAVLDFLAFSASQRSMAAASYNGYVVIRTLSLQGVDQVGLLQNLGILIRCYLQHARSCRVQWPTGYIKDEIF